MMFEWYGVSETGRRENNEDAYCGYPQWGVFAVADGMGGYAGGEDASRLAIAALEDFYRRNAADDEITWPMTPTYREHYQGKVEVAVRWAHRWVRNCRVGELDQMGSTLTMLQFSAKLGVAGHIGDSRLYRMRRGELVQLTADHSVYEMLRASGTQLPPLRDFPHANMITKALGMENDPAPDVIAFKPKRGDVYLLCTDGLSGAIEEDHMARMMALKPAQVACERLVESAYQAGSRDNITAVVVRVKKAR